MGRKATVAGGRNGGFRATKPGTERQKHALPFVTIGCLFVTFVSISANICAIFYIYTYICGEE
jgi:hypothetical protein